MINNKRIMYKHIIFYVLIFILIFIGTFFVLEIGLRIARPLWQYVYNLSSQQDETFPIYVIGGSVSFGYPYYPKISFPKIVTYMLDKKIDDKNIKIINLASSSARLEHGYWRLFKELFLRPPKDGIVFIYAGINEVSNTYRDPSFLYWKGIQKSFILSKILWMYESRLTNPRAYEHIYPTRSLCKYNYRLEKVIKLAHRFGLKVIVSTLAGNLSEYPPATESFFEFLDKNISRQFVLGEQNEKAGNVYKAIQIYKTVLPQCDTNPAYVYYCLGRCYHALKDYEKAKEYYWQAVDNESEDRATREQNRIIRKVAAKHKIRLVDAATIFEHASSDRLVGYDLFADGHHPNLKGYILLAKGFVEEMVKQCNVKVLHYDPNEEDIVDHFNFDQNDFFHQYILLVRWFCGKTCLDYRRMDRPNRAEYYLRKAEAIYSDDLNVFMGHLMISLIKRERKDILYWLDKGKFFTDNKHLLDEIRWLMDYYHEMNVAHYSGISESE